MYRTDIDIEKLTEAIVYFNIIEKQLNLFTDYSNYIDSSLEKELKKQTKKTSKGKVKDEYLKYEFPNIMRSTLLISIYSFFEERLVLICKSYETEEGLMFDDIRGRSVIDRAKKYIEKVIKMDFPSNNEHWKHLREINLIRNCIVHNGGIVSSESSLECIVNEMNNISLNENNGKIMLEKGFIDDTIRHVDKFYRKLLLETDINLNKLIVSDEMYL